MRPLAAEALDERRVVEGPGFRQTPGVMRFFRTSRCRFPQYAGSYAVFPHISVPILTIRWELCVFSAHLGADSHNTPGVIRFFRTSWCRFPQYAGSYAVFPHILVPILTIRRELCVFSAHLGADSHNTMGVVRFFRTSRCRVPPNAGSYAVFPHISVPILTIRRELCGFSAHLGAKSRRNGAKRTALTRLGGQRRAKRG